MTGRLHIALSGFLLIVFFSVGIQTAYALDADPTLIATPDKKPFVMTVMGVRKAFPVAADTIRVEIGVASNPGAVQQLQSYRITSEDDPGYPYEDFIRPLTVARPKNARVLEVSVPEGFKSESRAGNTSEFYRETVDLKLPRPMQPGKTYAVITRGTGEFVVSAGRAAYEFRYDPDDISSRVYDMLF